MAEASPFLTASALRSRILASSSSASPSPSSGRPRTGGSVKVAVALFIPDGERGTEHLRILSKLAVMVSDANFCSSVFDAGEASPRSSMRSTFTLEQ